jgi:hypothetical protein
LFHVALGRVQLGGTRTRVIFTGADGRSICKNKGVCLPGVGGTHAHGGGGAGADAPGWVKRAKFADLVDTICGVRVMIGEGLVLVAVVDDGLGAFEDGEEGAEGRKLSAPWDRQPVHNVTRALHAASVRDSGERALGALMAASGAHEMMHGRPAVWVRSSSGAQRCAELLHQCVLAKACLHAGDDGVSHAALAAMRGVHPTVESDEEAGDEGRLTKVSHTGVRTTARAFHAVQDRSIRRTSSKKGKQRKQPPCRSSPSGAAS